MVTDDDQAPVAHAARRTAAFAMCAQHRVIVIERKPAQRALDVRSTLAQQRVAGVEHQQPRVANGARDDELDVGERVEIVDAVLAEMIGTHVGDHGHVDPVRREPATQDAAARCLEHRGLHARVAQDRARAHRPGIIAARNRLAADEKTIRAVEAVAPPARPQTRGDEPHGGRLAVGARHERGRNIVQR